MHASVTESKTGGRIIVRLQHSLDANTYNIPLTLKTYVPEGWKKVEVKQDDFQKQFQPQKDSKGNYILYTVNPNKGAIELSK